VLAEEADVQAALRRRWGPAVFAADGSVDRAAVARRVFAPGSHGDDDRRFLEGLLHPRIRQRLEAAHKVLLARGGPAIVLDAAVMLEAGWNALCDVVVFVDAPRQIRQQRARQRGWSDEQFAAREAAQWPIEEKRRRADVVLINGGSNDELRLEVRAFWDDYVVK
jgi:dephospho-CoA kinase